jgi:Kef-type K+ transport system membrane component KefB
MSDLLNFLLAVAFILIAAKASGYVSVRLGQPSILGELLVGLILGPTVLNMLNAVPGFAGDDHLAESLSLFAEIGVLLLMFLAGLELEMAELLRSGRVASMAGTLGVIIPLIGGYLTALLFGLGSTEAVFIGLALSATSVSISAQTLMELGVLRSKVGLALLGAAVFDDVLVVLLLSATSVVFGVGGSEGGGVGTIIIRMILFLVGATAVGIFALPTLLRQVSKLPISQGITAFGLVSCLLFAWASEALGGVAAITGAFMAGLFIARTFAADRIEEGISAMAYGLFVPIFLVNIGLQANLRDVSGSLWLFAIILTIVAVVTKVIGSGGGALLAGFNRRDSLRLGVGMISRGEVGLIVASVALSQQMIQRESFSVVVFMIVVATLVTPFLLRTVYKPEPQKGTELVQDETPLAPGDLF